MTREAFQEGARDEQDMIYLSPLLPQVVERLDYIKRAVAKMAGDLPSHVATQTDLERAVDTGIRTVGPLAANNLGLIGKAARDNLKGKLFNKGDLVQILTARLEGNEGSK